MSCLLKIFTKNQEFNPISSKRKKNDSLWSGKYTQHEEFQYETSSNNVISKKNDKKDHQDAVVGISDTRDSGFLEEERSIQNECSESDVLNPPIENTNIRRKEGLIFSRPDISDERNSTVSVYTKDEKIRNLIRNAIEKNDFLNNYMGNKERKDIIIDAMEPATYEAGDYIIKEDEEGSEIYVSEDGIYDVIKNDEIIDTIGSGIVFGELAILYNAKRFASIKAASKAKVWKIDRKKFRKIMVNYGSKEREENLNFLKSAPFLKDIDEETLLQIVDLLKRVFFESNTCIIRQGDVGNDFYIIRGNTVTVKKTNEYGETKIVNRLRRGEYFGEQALINEDYRLASVYADPPGTECLKLDRESFISLLGPIKELRKKPVDKIVLPEIKRPSAVNRAYDHIQLSDLERVATLGAGAFGRVDLVTYNKTQSYALKIIEKIKIIRQEQIDHIYNEKLVMVMCQHCPFIVELYKTFRDNKYVYILMEACLGGDIWTIMHERGYFDEPTAKFLVACVVEAFDFLHARNIVYRDLKPENLMLTPDGYCKLVDFGFAKRLNQNYKTNTFVGTPEYLAPEIILDRGHDRAVDYWSLGILIHELLVGKPPFNGPNQMRIFQKILGGIDVVRMSTKIPRPAQILIKQLCKQTPAERLGYQKKGVADIKKHSWFDGFDWNRLHNKKLSSPIQRPVSNTTDIRYFSVCAEDSDIPPDETSGWDNDF